jgi:protein-S-isoprenylcysteine O-methyltransferase Ste14
MTTKLWSILIAEIAGMAALFGALLFGGAGTLAWAPGWTFLVLFFGATLAVSFILARTDPELLKERMKPHIRKEQTPADKKLMSVISVAFIAWLFLMGLDGRFHWSAMPAALPWLGRIGLLVGFWLAYRTFRENTYLSGIIQVQSERGHTVISTGPYAIVRHPFYFAAGIIVVSIALVLGSWPGLLASLLLMLGIAKRIGIEERALIAGLRGYADYRERVRYRLIPFIW